MTSTNNITGDKLTTGSVNDAYRTNYDAIFGNNKRNADSDLPSGDTRNVSGVGTSELAENGAGKV